MSADIIPFIRFAKQKRERTDFPVLTFRSTTRPDDLVMDHADTSPCEYVPSECFAPAPVKT